MRNFEGFTRKAVVIVPTDEEFKSRTEKQANEEKKDVPESAVLEMKANFTLPDKDVFDEVIYVELQEEEAQALIQKYAKEANELGYVKKTPHGGFGPAHKRFRGGDFHQRNDFRSRDRFNPPGPPGGFRQIKAVSAGLQQAIDRDGGAHLPGLLVTIAAPETTTEVAHHEVVAADSTVTTGVAPDPASIIVISTATRGALEDPEEVQETRQGKTLASIPVVVPVLQRQPLNGATSGAIKPKPVRGDNKPQPTRELGTNRRNGTIRRGVTINNNGKATSKATISKVTGSKATTNLITGSNITATTSKADGVNSRTAMVATVIRRIGRTGTQLKVLDKRARHSRQPRPNEDIPVRSQKTLPSSKMKCSCNRKMPASMRIGIKSEMTVHLINTRK
ncbi:unnamed protein product [Nesidiocoris tenuis]|uniref:Uncharacterized protein n=1 Tax=Nesidiocoris tenuis TaxID=355587 RepID=A0A6H5GN47_9HEMI|nr:unnamed protein product [Nesidiocoris tenuis]